MDAGHRHREADITYLGADKDRERQLMRERWRERDRRGGNWESDKLLALSNLFT